MTNPEYTDHVNNPTHKVTPQPALIGNITGSLGSKGRRLTWRRLPGGQRIVSRSGGSPKTADDCPKMWLNRKNASVLDHHWGAIGPEERALWNAQADIHKPGEYSGLDYFRHVNMLRLFFGLAPALGPPDTTQSQRRHLVGSEDPCHPPTGTDAWLYWLVVSIPESSAPPVLLESAAGAFAAAGCDPIPPFWTPAVTMTLTSSSGGYIDGEPQQRIEICGSYTISAYPDTGYVLDALTLDGVIIPNHYTAQNLQEDSHAHADFAAAEPQPCPPNHDLCPAELDLCISGMTGDVCNDRNPGAICTDLNGCWTLALYESDYWENVDLTGNDQWRAQLTCRDSEWELELRERGFGSLCAMFTAPNTTGCPPADGWTRIPYAGRWSGCHDGEITLDWD